MTTRDEEQSHFSSAAKLLTKDVLGGAIRVVVADVILQAANPLL